MNLDKVKDREFWAREAAALTAEGYDSAAIWQRLDISLPELEQIYALAEFERALRALGDATFEAWQLEREVDDQRVSVRRKAASHADEYFDQLHDLAVGESLRPEEKAKYLVKLLEIGDQMKGKEDIGELKLSPQTLRLMKETFEMVEGDED